MVNGDPSSVQIFWYFSADARPRFGRMNRWRTNHHPARFIGAMDAGGQIRQAQVWFEADTDNPSGGELHKARGLGTAGVPVFTRSTPERFPSGTMFITFLRSRHDETVEFRPGKSVIV